MVSRKYLLNEHPDVIVNIIDGVNLERNLYLTTQLLDLGIPVVVAVNRMDVVRNKGDIIDVKGLSEALGAEVVEISALKRENLDGLMEAAKAAKDRYKKAISFTIPKWKRQRKIFATSPRQ